MLKKIDNKAYPNSYVADLDGCNELENNGFEMQRNSVAPLGFPSGGTTILVVYGKVNDDRIVYVSDRDTEALLEKFGISLQQP